MIVNINHCLVAVVTFTEFERKIANRTPLRVAKDAMAGPGNNPVQVLST
jgi:hypothetical protein